MVTTLLLVLVSVATCAAREFNCTRDQNSCTTGSDVQEIIISGERMCCPKGAQFRVDNDQCTCVDNTAMSEEGCLTGQGQCDQAPMTSRDSAGNVRCCRPGYILNSVTHSYVNGMLMDLCTCTPPGGDSFLSMFPGQAQQGGSPVNRGPVTSTLPGFFHSSLHISTSHLGGTGSSFFGAIWHKKNPHPASSGMLARSGSHWRDMGRKMRSWMQDLRQFLTNRTRLFPFAAYRPRTTSESEGRTATKGWMMPVRRTRPMFFRTHPRRVIGRPVSPPFAPRPTAPPEPTTRPPSAGRRPLEP